MTDTVHDPGPDAAAQTFDGSTDVAANPLELKSGGTVRIGTASWTDPTMTASGVFYPTGADSAEERLQFTPPDSRWSKSMRPTTPFRSGARRSCGSSVRRPTSRSISRPTP